MAAKQPIPQAEQQGGAQIEQDAHPHPFPDAVKLLGAKILAHKGGHRDPIGVGSHEEKGVQLPIGAPGGHDVGAKGVDAGLDQNIRDAVHIRLKPRRQAHRQQSFQFPAIETDLLHLHLVDCVLMQQGQNDEHSAHHLGEDGGDGRSGHPPVKYHHKHQVQHDVGQTGGDQKIEGPPGVPHRPQDG